MVLNPETHMKIEGFFIVVKIVLVRSQKPLKPNKIQMKVP
jgi:hypothetical protein